jgi:hypothetical protein
MSDATCIQNPTGSSLLPAPGACGRTQPIPGDPDSWDVCASRGGTAVQRLINADLVNSPWSTNARAAAGHISIVVGNLVRASSLPSLRTAVLNLHLQMLESTHVAASTELSESYCHILTELCITGRLISSSVPACILRTCLLVAG